MEEVGIGEMGRSGGEKSKEGGGDGEDLWNREVVIDDCFFVGDLHDNTFMNTYIPHIVS